MRDAERIGLAIKVEAGHLGEPHPRVQAFGIGLAGEHLDVVAEFGQTPGKMPYIHTLTTAMSFASVREKGYTHVSSIR
ncbi:hypothetical protein GCM10010409_54280 [Mycolicibacterium diernhoferi]